MALYKYDSTANKLVPLTSEGNVGLPVGAVLSFPAGTTQAGWLLCDGSTFDRTVYPALYTYLGNSNVLPDYRECVLVGVGQNDTDTIAVHDVYDLGQFKDDQLQDHKHNVSASVWKGDAWGNDRIGYGGGGGWTNQISVSVNGVKTDSARVGTTTHGKQKGVAYYIKATSAGPEVEPDIYATKGYIRDQNILSDYEAIDLSSPVTMQYDGFLSVIALSSARNIYVNDVRITTASPVADIDGSGSIAFKKGDVVKLSSYYSGCAKVAYYKLRDYTGR